MNDKKLSLRTLIDAKVLMYTSDDALDKTTAAIYAWHTRKLNEAVLAELNRLYVEHNRHFGTDTCELIKERITEIKLESIYERRHS